MPSTLLRLNDGPRLPSWDDRYDDLERRRANLLARLAKAVSLRSDEYLRRTPTTLINEKFRAAAKLAQRGATLTSAEWLVRMIETSI